MFVVFSMFLIEKKKTNERKPWLIFCSSWLLFKANKNKQTKAKVFVNLSYFSNSKMDHLNSTGGLQGLPNNIPALGIKATPFSLS